MKKDSLDIRLVRQRHPTECGVACFAMLSRMSLSEARESIQFANDGDYRTYPSDLKIALAKERIVLGRKVCSSSWDSLFHRPVRALAAVRYTVNVSGRERWHWLIFDGAGQKPLIFDPEKGVRTDFGRIRLSWYHIIKYS